MKMELALAAVPLRDVRPYMKGWNRNNKTVKLLRKFMPRYNKKGYRAYFSLDKAASVEPRPKVIPPQPLISIMQQLGYIITDFVANRCVKLSDTASKNEFKITGVLAKAKSLNDIQKKHFIAMVNNDHRRQGVSASKRLLVVSCHPYDIIGMSTGRGWTSCMNIHGGSNNHFVARDLAFGVMVVYAIDADDTNIQHPICRCLIKPFKSKSGHTLYHRETRVYGTKVAGFDAVLAKFLRVLNKKAPPDYYEQVEHLYKDGSTTSISHKGKSQSPQVKVNIQAPKIPNWFGPDAVGKFIEETNLWFGNGEADPDFKYVGNTQAEKDFLSLVLFLAVNSHVSIQTARIKATRLDYEAFDELMKKYRVKHAWHGGNFSVHDQRYGLDFTSNTLKKYPQLVHYQNPASFTGNMLTAFVDDYMDVDTTTSGSDLRSYLETMLGSFTKEVDHVKEFINDRDAMVEREIDRLLSERPVVDVSDIESEYDHYHKGTVADLLDINPDPNTADDIPDDIRTDAYDNVDSRIEVYKSHAGSLYDMLYEICETIDEEMSHAEEQQNDLDEDDPEYDDKYAAFGEVWDILDGFKGEFDIIKDEAGDAASDKY